MVSWLPWVMCKQCKLGGFIQHFKTRYVGVYVNIYMCIYSMVIIMVEAVIIIVIINIEG